MNNKITFQELVNDLANSTGESRRFMHDFLSALSDVITEGLLEDGNVRIKDLGRFSLKWIKAYPGRNPNTNDPIEIPAHNKAIFKPQKSLETLVNQDYNDIEMVPLENDELSQFDQLARGKKEKQSDLSSQEDLESQLRADIDQLRDDHPSNDDSAFEEEENKTEDDDLSIDADDQANKDEEIQEYLDESGPKDTDTDMDDIQQLMTEIESGDPSISETESHDSDFEDEGEIAETPSVEDSDLVDDELRIDADDQASKDEEMPEYLDESGPKETDTDMDDIQQLMTEIESGDPSISETESHDSDFEDEGEIAETPSVEDSDLVDDELRIDADDQASKDEEMPEYLDESGPKETDTDMDDIQQLMTEIESGDPSISETESHDSDFEDEGEIAETPSVEDSDLVDDELSIDVDDQASKDEEMPEYLDESGPKETDTEDIQQLMTEIESEDPSISETESHDSDFEDEGEIAETPSVEDSDLVDDELSMEADYSESKEEHSEPIENIEEIKPIDREIPEMVEEKEEEDSSQTLKEEPITNLDKNSKMVLEANDFDDVPPLVEKRETLRKPFALDYIEKRGKHKPIFYVLVVIVILGVFIYFFNHFKGSAISDSKTKTTIEIVDLEDNEYAARSTSAVIYRGKKQADISKAIERRTVPQPESYSPEVYRTLRGATLWQIAWDYYRNSFLWPIIYQANSDFIDNPNLIYIDQNLMIPKLDGEGSQLSEQDLRRAAEGYLRIYLSFEKKNKYGFEGFLEGSQRRDPDVSKEYFRQHPSKK